MTAFGRSSRRNAPLTVFRSPIRQLARGPHRPRRLDPGTDLVLEELRRGGRSLRRDLPRPRAPRQPLHGHHDQHARRVPSARRVLLRVLPARRLRRARGHVLLRGFRFGDLARARRRRGSLAEVLRGGPHAARLHGWRAAGCARRRRRARRRARPAHAPRRGGGFRGRAERLGGRVRHLETAVGEERGRERGGSSA